MPHRVKHIHRRDRSRPQWTANSLPTSHFRFTPSLYSQTFLLYMQTWMFMLGMANHFTQQWYRSIINLTSGAWSLELKLQFTMTSNNTISHSPARSQPFEAGQHGAESIVWDGLLSPWLIQNPHKPNPINQIHHWSNYSSTAIMPESETKYPAPTRHSKRVLIPSVNNPGAREVTDYQFKRMKRWVVASITSVIFYQDPTLTLFLSYPLLILYLLGAVAKGLAGSESER